jgi:hypothetical protein
MKKWGSKVFAHIRRYEVTLKRQKYMHITSTPSSLRSSGALLTQFLLLFFPLPWALKL